MFMIVFLKMSHFTCFSKKTLQFSLQKSVRLDIKFYVSRFKKIRMAILHQKKVHLVQYHVSNSGQNQARMRKKKNRPIIYDTFSQLLYQSSVFLSSRLLPNYRLFNVVSNSQQIFFQVLIWCFLNLMYSLCIQNNLW